jgi:hypothetical protein
MNFVWIILYLKNVRGSAHERLFLSPAETGPSGIPNPTSMSGTVGPPPVPVYRYGFTGTWNPAGPAQDLVEGKPGKV